MNGWTFHTIFNGVIAVVPEILNFVAIILFSLTCYEGILSGNGDFKARRRPNLSCSVT